MKLCYFVKRIFAALLCLLLVPVVSAAELKSLKYVTESYPPYNFKAGGEVKGIAVDLLLEAMKQSGNEISAKDLSLQPWTRAYQAAVKGPNTVLFSTTRTEQREPLFQWVGPISDTRVVLLARKDSNIALSSASDAANYKIGVIRDDIGEQLTLSKGIPDAKLKRIGKASALAKMLAKGRVDLWAYEENVARWFIKSNGLNNDDFVTVLVLSEGQLYYSFSPDVDAALVQQLQQAVDSVKGSSLYQEILGRYL